MSVEIKTLRKNAISAKFEEAGPISDNINDHKHEIK